MARITSTFTPEPDVFPYAGMAEAQADKLNIVRAELRFQINGDAITISGAGDDQEAVIDVNLPRNFAYVHLESHIGIICTDSTQWESVAWGGLQNGRGGMTRDWIAPIEHFSNGATTFGGRRIWTAQAQVKSVILPASPGENGEWQFRVGNPTLDQAAGTMFALIRFLQFDVEQAHHFAVNNPMPVR